MFQSAAAETPSNGEGCTVRSKAAHPMDRKQTFGAAIRLLREKKDPGAAIDLLERYVPSCPRDQRHLVLADLAFVQEEAGDTSAALKSLTKAISLSRSYPGHRDARALLALRLGRHKVVENDCAALLRIEKRRGARAFVEAAHVTMAVSFIQRGDGRAALRELESVARDGIFRRCGRTVTTLELEQRARALLG